MSAMSIKIDRRMLTALVVSTFVGTACVAATTGHPAIAAEKSKSESAGKNKQEGCNKYARDSKEYQDCMKE